MKIEKVAGANLPKVQSKISPAVIAGDFVFVTGQGGQNPATGEYAEGDVKAQTKQALENVSVILKEAGSSLDKIVYATTYLAGMELWLDYNEVWGECFKDFEVYPARATVQSNLEHPMLVEIQVIAVRKN